ncbi:hypothetical protein [Volucribacter amazonae]|uniref:Uncharacterized protein n=1 Tax=Volucribacter amazonae TaxID=256731 RepID=A0A9X4SPR6_9PAST|nr:hypothetical protein [Volucribacter amazonae]MDG6894401.1 hypothetical protein [Volucribacter amazonae]
MKKFCQHLLDKIEDLQPDYFRFDEVVYSAMELLKEKEHIDVMETVKYLTVFFIEYVENDCFNEICNKFREKIKNNPSKEKYFFNKAYLSGELKDGDYPYDLGKVCNYLNMLNPDDWIDNYEWLEKFITENNLIDKPVTNIELGNVVNIKSYELMALLALYYVSEVIETNNIDIQFSEYNNRSSCGYGSAFGSFKEFYLYRLSLATRDVISAFRAIHIAQNWKDYIDNSKINEDIAKKVLTANARKGGQKRHEKSNRIKEKIIAQWREYETRERERGRIPSKNQFAKKMTEIFKVSEATIRKNWLQKLSP